MNAALILIFAVVWFWHAPEAERWLGHVVTSIISVQSGASFHTDGVRLDVLHESNRLILRFSNPHWQSNDWQLRADSLTLTIGYARHFDVYLTQLTLDQPTLIINQTSRASSPLISWQKYVTESLHTAENSLGRAQVIIDGAFIQHPALTLQDAHFTLSPSPDGLRVQAQANLHADGVRLPLTFDADIGNRNLTGRLTSQEARIGDYDVESTTLSMSFQRESFQGDADLAVTLDDLSLGLAMPFRVLPYSINIEPTVSLSKMPYDTLMRLWPEAIAPNPREWMAENLKNGVIHDLTATANLLWPDSQGEVTLVSLTGGARLDGFSAQYLDGMAWINTIAGTASFNEDTLTLNLTKGKTKNISIDTARLHFYDLAEDVPMLAIDATVKGSLRNGLLLINQPPLAYADTFGLTPSAVTGNTITRLELTLPLLADLDMEDIQLKATSTLTNASLPVPNSDLMLSDGALTLIVTPEAAQLEGAVTLNGMRGQLRWETSFSQEAALRETATFTTTVQAAELAAFIPPALLSLDDTGVGLPVTIVYEQHHTNDKTIILSVDTTASPLRVPVLAWEKTQGQRTTLDVSLLQAADGSWRIAPFRLTSGSDKINLVARLDSRFTLTALTLANAHLGDTRIEKLTYKQNDNNYDLILEASQLSLDKNAALTLQDDDAPPSTASGKVYIRVGTLALKGGLPLTDVTLDATQANGQWQSLNAAARLNEASLTAEIRPRDTRTRFLTLTSNNVGAMLRGFDVTQSVIGGSVTIAGTLNRHDHLTSLLTMRDFRVKDLPLLARLLSIASFTAPLDFLTGEGLPFSRLEGGLYYRDGTITLNDMRMTGSSLGLHATGDMNPSANTVNLEGAILPAYMLTNVVGSIPIIGDLLTLGKSEGLIAMRYTARGKLDDPSVSVNPLSALTPGFLRRFFDIFDAPIKPVAPVED